MKCLSKCPCSINRGMSLSMFLNNRVSTKNVRKSRFSNRISIVGIRTELDLLHKTQNFHGEVAEELYSTIFNKFPYISEKIKERSGKYQTYVKMFSTNNLLKPS